MKKLLVLFVFVAFIGVTAAPAFAITESDQIVLADIDDEPKKKKEDKKKKKSSKECEEKKSECCETKKKCDEKK